MTRSTHRFEGNDMATDFTIAHDEAEWLRGLATYPLRQGTRDRLHSIADLIELLAHRINHLTNANDGLRETTDGQGKALAEGGRFGRGLFVRAAEVTAGRLLIADGGFTCMTDGHCFLVAEDANGLYVGCAEGRHYLDGQLSNGRYIGLRPFSRARLPA